MINFELFLRFMNQSMEKFDQIEFLIKILSENAYLLSSVKYFYKKFLQEFISANLKFLASCKQKYTKSYINFMDNDSN